jgi:hypothetical protein
VVNYEVKLGQRDHLLDLSWPERLVALEYHGAQHFSDSSQARDDVSGGGAARPGAGSVLVGVKAEGVDVVNHD